MDLFNLLQYITPNHLFHCGSYHNLFCLVVGGAGTATPRSMVCQARCWSERILPEIPTRMILPLASPTPNSVMRIWLGVIKPTGHLFRHFKIIHLVRTEYVALTHAKSEMLKSIHHSFMIVRCYAGGQRVTSAPNKAGSEDPRHQIGSSTQEIHRDPRSADPWAPRRQGCSSGQ